MNLCQGDLNAAYRMLNQPGGISFIGDSITWHWGAFAHAMLTPYKLAGVGVMATAGAGFGIAWTGNENGGGYVAAGFSQSPGGALTGITQTQYQAANGGIGGSFTVGAGIVSGGTGYAPGNILNVVQSGGAAGQVIVVTVVSGVITAINSFRPGYGYSSGAATTTNATGSGSGCTLTLSDIVEDESSDSMLQNYCPYWTEYVFAPSTTITGSNAWYEGRMATLQVADNADFSESNFLAHRVAAGDTIKARILFVALSNGINGLNVIANAPYGSGNYISPAQNTATLNTNSVTLGVPDRTLMALDVVLPTTGTFSPQLQLSLGWLLTITPTASSTRNDAGGVFALVGMMIWADTNSTVPSGPVPANTATMAPDGVVMTNLGIPGCWADLWADTGAGPSSGALGVSGFNNTLSTYNEFISGFGITSATIMLGANGSDQGSAAILESQIATIVGKLQGFGVKNIAICGYYDMPKQATTLAAPPALGSTEYIVPVWGDHYGLQSGSYSAGTLTFASGLSGYQNQGGSLGTDVFYATGGSGVTPGTIFPILGTNGSTTLTLASFPGTTGITGFIARVFDSTWCGTVPPGYKTAILADLALPGSGVCWCDVRSALGSGALASLSLIGTDGVHPVPQMYPGINQSGSSWGPGNYTGNNGALMLASAVNTCLQSGYSPGTDPGITVAVGGATTFSR